MSARRRRNQVWVTDATGVLTGQGWLYLVAVLDLCSRRVVGWAMSPILDAPLTIAALRMALRQRQPGRTLIVHSDWGSQFAGVRAFPTADRALDGVRCPSAGLSFKAAIVAGMRAIVNGNRAPHSRARLCVIGSKSSRVSGETLTRRL